MARKTSIIFGLLFLVVLLVLQGQQVVSGARFNLKAIGLVKDGIRSCPDLCSCTDYESTILLPYTQLLLDGGRDSQLELIDPGTTFVLGNWASVTSDAVTEYPDYAKEAVERTLARLATNCEEVPMADRIAWADKALAMPAQSPESLYALGLFYFRQNQWDKFVAAQQAYVTSVEPKSGDVIRLATGYRALDQHDDAIRALATLSEISDAEHIHALVLMADSYLKIKEPAQALLVLDEAQAQYYNAGSSYSQGARLFFLRGLTFEALGEIEQAMEAYQTALAIDPAHRGSKNRIKNLSGQ